MEAVGVAGQQTLNAKIEKPPGVMHVIDSKYYYVRIQKHPLEADEAWKTIGGITPPYTLLMGDQQHPDNKKFIRRLPFMAANNPNNHYNCGTQPIKNVVKDCHDYLLPIANKNRL